MSWTGNHSPIYGQSMSRKTELELLAAMAEVCGNCIDISQLPDQAALHRALQRRHSNGTFVRPHAGMYLPTSYWNSLTPDMKLKHVIATLARRNTTWIFAGTSAATVHRLEVPWTIIKDTCATIISTCHGYSQTTGRVRTVYARNVPVVTLEGPRLTPQNHDHHLCPRYASMTALCETLSAAATIRVTSVARTLVDCALQNDFKYVLPLFDSAFRQQKTTKDEILAVCDSVTSDCSPVFRALHYADPLSENGGESQCRAAVIECGYAIPELQHEFLDPDNSFNKARVDFVWHAPDGRVIVLEYDGMRKYVDPAMTKRRDVQQVVSDQIERDALLKRAGVTTVIHVTYDDIRDPLQLAAKLDRANAPMRTGLRFFERSCI